MIALVLGLSVQSVPNAAPNPSALPPPVLSLKQLTLPFGTDLNDAAKRAKVEAFRTATRTIAGCDSVEAIAAAQGATVVANNAVPMTTLPKPLQDVLTTLPVGKATPVFGNLVQGARVLVLCARD